MKNNNKETSEAIDESIKLANDNTKGYTNIEDFKKSIRCIVWSCKLSFLTDLKKIYFTKRKMEQIGITF